MKILKNIMVLMFALVVVTGCKDKNPLIGKWTIDLASLSGDTRMIIENTSQNRTIEFTRDKMIFDDQALLVSYEINGKLVKVRPSGKGNPVVIVVKDDGSITMPTPQAGTLRYVRVKKYDYENEKAAE